MWGPIIANFPKKSYIFPDNFLNNFSIFNNFKQTFENYHNVRALADKKSLFLHPKNGSSKLLVDLSTEYSFINYCNRTRNYITQPHVNLYNDVRSPIWKLCSNTNLSLYLNYIKWKISPDRFSFILDERKMVENSILKN